MLPDFIKEPSDLAGYYMYIELYIPWKGEPICIELSYASKEDIFELMDCSEVKINGNVLTIVMDGTFLVERIM